MENSQFNTELERQIYQRRIENRRIEMAVLETAEMEGFEKGKMEGIVETAKNLKKMGLSIEDISKATGLSETEIEKL